jgi:hypothetical protein
MGGFLIYYVPKGAIHFSVDVNVQEWKVASLLFPLQTVSCCGVNWGIQHSEHGESLISRIPKITVLHF